MDKRIATAIILAQIASDAGKGDYELAEYCNRLVEAYGAKEKGYRKKDDYIRKAIALIRHYGAKEVYYHVQMDEKIRQNRNGDPAFIIYFNWKIDGKRYQASFHSFGNWYQYLGGSCRTHWDRRDSRKACAALYDACFMAG